MKILYFIIFILCLISTKSFAQGEISEDETIVFKNEKSAGASFNTNGWGIDYRQGYFINIHKSSIFQIEFNVLKHQQEKKTYSLLDATRRYVYGKQNFCFDFRLGVGLQQQLYLKKDVGSVEIRTYILIGPVLGYKKPIYYIITDTTTRIEKYMPSHQRGTIKGHAAFAKGFSEIKMNPGFYVRLGLGFEHGKINRTLRSLDVGIMAFAYMNEMKILANDYNSRFFVSLFLNYRMGSFLYGRHLKYLNDKDN